MNNAERQAHTLRLQHSHAADTRTVYLPEFGRAVRISEFDRPMQSDDTETAQTVQIMDQIAAEDANTPQVEAAVSAALDEAGISEQASAYEKACAVYWWLQRTIRYVPTPGTSIFVDQTLITPCAVLAMPEPIGDCPQFSMLAAAMFRILGMQSMFVTIAADDAAPDQWSHIYNTVEVYPGQYLPFDSSNGPEPGAEYARPYKRKVWPAMSGRSKETSADMIRNFKAAGRRSGMRNAALYGLRDVTDGVYTSDETMQSQIDAINNLSDSVYGPGNDIMTGPTVPINSPALQIDSSSGTAGNIFAELATDFTKIAAPFIQSQQQPYYITTAAGQKVLYNPATGSVVQTASAISPTVIVGGVVILALLLMGGNRR